MAISTTARTGLSNGTFQWTAKSLFNNGSNLYAVVLDTSAVKLRVYKSTNNGTSWTEQDSANAPAHYSATASYDAAVPVSGSTNLIHVVRRLNFPEECYVRRFNMSTDLWETTDVGGVGSTVAATLAISTYNIRVAVRSDGDVLLFYKNSSTNNLDFTRYEGGSSWNVAVNFHAAAAFPLDVVMTGNSDMAHVWFYLDAANDLNTKTLSNANVQGTLNAIDTTCSIYYGTSSGYVNDGGTHRIAHINRDSGGDSDLYYSTSATNPTYSSVATAIASSTTDMGIMGGNLVGLNSKWYMIWSGDTRGTIHMNVSDDYTSPAFGTVTNLVTGLSNDPVVHARAVGTALGVLYTSGASSTTVDFAWAVAPATTHQGSASIASASTVAAKGRLASDPIIQAVGPTQTGTASATPTYSGFSTTTGSTLVAIINPRTGSGTVNSIADSAGNTWTQVAFGNISGSNTRTEIWKCENATGITSLTPTFSVSVTSAFALYELKSGITFSVANDRNSTDGTANATSITNPSTNSVTTSATNSVIIGALGFATTNDVSSVSSPFTKDVSIVGSGTVMGIATASAVVTSSGTYEATFTMAGSTNAGGAIAAFTIPVATTHQGSAAIASSSTVGSSGKRIALAAATVASASTVASSGKRTQRGSAAIVSASTVGSTSTLVARSTSAIASASTATASGVLTQRASATIASTSALTAGGKLVRLGSATSASASALTSAGFLTQRASAAITSASTLTADGTRIPAPLDLSNRDLGFSINGVPFPYVSKENSGDFSFSNKGVPVAFVATVQGGTTHSASAAIASTSTIAAQGQSRLFASASVDSASSVTATAKKLIFASAPIQGVSSISSSARLLARASASMASASALTAVGTLITAQVVHQGAAAIASASIVTSAAKRTQRGSAAIASVSTVASQGRIVKKAAASITDTSSVAATAGALRRASAAVDSASQIAALGFLTQRGQAAIESASDLTARGTVRFAVSYVEATADVVPTLQKADIYPSVLAHATPNTKAARSYSTITATSRRAYD